MIPLPVGLHQELVSGKLEVSTAAPTGQGCWDGSRKPRLVFDDVSDDRYKIAVETCKYFGNNYRIMIDGKKRTICLNTNSLIHRFGYVPQNLFETIHEIKQTLEEQKQRLETIPLEIQTLKTLLGKGHRRGDYPSQEALEKMLAYAKEKQKPLRLSKHSFEFPKSIFLNPEDDFIAIDGDRFFGKGKYGQVKSAFHGHQELAKRTAKINPDTLEALSFFRDTPGVLPTLSIGTYENKEGRRKMVSYHPAFNFDFDHFLRQIAQPLPFWAQASIIKQLLVGLVNISQLGVHFDIRRKNILISISPEGDSLKAVISDFDLFQFYKKLKTIYGGSHMAPEARKNRGKVDRNDLNKLDIWSLGLIFFMTCQTQKAPKLAERYFRDADQRIIDQSISDSHFAPSLIPLIRGMLSIDPKERWSPEQAWGYVKEIFRSSHG